jgi:phosphoglycolate phosphatase
LSKDGGCLVISTIHDLDNRVIKLALFDIDGTLIRTGGAGVRAFAKAFETEFRLNEATRDVSFCGRTDTGLARQCFIQNQVEPSPENMKRFFESYVFWLSYYLERLEGGPCEGILSFLEQLRMLPHKPRIGLLTGNIRLGAEIKLRHYNLWDWFEVGAFADDHQDRNEIAKLAHKLGSEHLKTALKGEEILVIGDTPFDIACGKAIGAKVLAVGTGNFHPSELLKHEPDWAVPNLSGRHPSGFCGTA